MAEHEIRLELSQRVLYPSDRRRRPAAEQVIDNELGALKLIGDVAVVEKIEEVPLGSERSKAQPLAADAPLEVGVHQHFDRVSSRPELAAEADVRVDVAGGA